MLRVRLCTGSSNIGTRKKQAQSGKTCQQFTIFFSLAAVYRISQKTALNERNCHALAANIHFDEKLMCLRSLT